MKKIKIPRGKFDKNLLQRQEIAIDRWQANKGRGTVIGPTGVGKTFIGLLGIERCINSGIDRKYERNVLVVVPTVVIKEQWESLLEKFRINNTTVAVANTAVKFEDRFELLILDEVHRFASNVFKKCFQIPHSFRLGLTASLERSDNKHELIEKKAPVIDEITVNEALDNGWISDFTIYNIPIDLDQQDRRELEQLNKKFKSFFATFNHDFDQAMACISKQQAEKYARSLNKSGWTTERIQIHAVQFSLAMRKRKELLYKTNSKLNSALKILEKGEFKNRKVITFSQSTEIADRLTDNLNTEKEIAVSYHSNIPTIKDENGKKKGVIKRKKENMKRFNDGRTTVKIINTAKALDEGFDVSDITRTILISGTSEPRQFLQRLGRSLRKKEGKHAIMVCFYIRDSQDAKWLRNAQKWIRKDKIVEVESVDKLFEESVIDKRPNVLT